MPDISVIVPTFNRAELLRTALQSVLDQVDADFEVVVSDNCSSDQTPDVVGRFTHDPRIRYSRNKQNLGMVGNWKKAIYELARSEWFVLMSDDDRFVESSYLSRVVAAIREHSPAFVYAGGYVEDATSGQTTTLRLPFDGVVPGEQIFAARGTGNPQDAILCNMAFRRSDAERLGFLSQPDNLSCDSELYLMLCAEGPAFAVPDPVCVYLKHGANLVDRIRTSRTLLDRNLDHLVMPYAYARKRGMNASSLASFRVNTRLDRAIGSTLLKLWLHNAEWYAECRKRMSMVLPDVLAEVEGSSWFRARQSVLWAGRKYFKRRFPLTNNAVGST